MLSVHCRVRVSPRFQSVVCHGHLRLSSSRCMSLDRKYPQIYIYRNQHSNLHGVSNDCGTNYNDPSNESGRSCDIRYKHPRTLSLGGGACRQKVAGSRCAGACVLKHSPPYSTAVWQIAYLIYLCNSDRSKGFVCSFHMLRPRQCEPLTLCDWAMGLFSLLFIQYRIFSRVAFINICCLPIILCCSIHG